MQPWFLPTLWIGSPGSNTQCHYDTYGFNLVGQVHGSKRCVCHPGPLCILGPHASLPIRRWWLYPPSSTRCLYPTRVPYEESRWPPPTFFSFPRVPLVGRNPQRWLRMSLHGQFLPKACRTAVLATGEIGSTSLLHSVYSQVFVPAPDLTQFPLFPAAEGRFGVCLRAFCSAPIWCRNYC